MPMHARRLFEVFRIIAVLAAFVSISEASSFGRVADVDGYTNMRTQPTTQGDVVAWVMNGSCVELLGMENGWYKVKMQPVPQQGYIYRKNLKVMESCSKPTEFSVPGKCDLALDALFRLEAFPDLQEWKAQYTSCLDKEMKAAVSEVVLHKLSVNWKTHLPALVKMEDQPEFISFVTSSITTASDSTRLLSIQSFAQRACPASSKSLCESIFQATSEGLKRR